MGGIYRNWGAYQYTGGGGASGSSLLTSLVSYWKLDEASTGVAPVTRIDSVTSTGNDLTDNNTVASGTGIIGNAASFIAANSESLSRASNSSLELGGNQLFTLAGWFQLAVNPAAGVNTFIDKIGNNSESVFRLYNTFGTLTFDMYTAEFAGGIIRVIQTANIISTWYFFVAWYDGANLNLTVNNGATNSTANAVSAWDGTPRPVFEIGSASMTGLVDEVGFWKRVLTPAERTSLYNGGAGLSYPF